MSSYSDKLKLPKWQKMRLLIFLRDDWKCTKCGNADKPLHVHHKRYKKSAKSPWDYKIDSLVTLCEDCHRLTHKKPTKKEDEGIYQEVSISAIPSMPLYGFASVSLGKRDDKFDWVAPVGKTMLEILRESNRESELKNGKN